MKKVIIISLLILLFSSCDAMTNKSYNIKENVEVISSGLANQISFSDLVSVIAIMSNIENFPINSDEGQLYSKLKNRNYIKEIEEGTAVKIKKGNLVGPGLGYSVVFSYDNKEYFWYDRSLFMNFDVEEIRDGYKKQNFSDYFDY